MQKITLFQNEEMALVEGEEYEVTYVNDGESFTDIKIKFLIGSHSRLTRLPTNSDVIKFEYLYTPNSDSIRSRSSHQIIDTRVKKKINEKWDVFLKLQIVNITFPKTSQFKKETFTTQQIDNIYQLGNAPIEENSELIFINGFSQSRDVDYYINYERGSVTFLNKTIPSGQKVEISYNYFLSDTSNIGDANAYSFESNYRPSKTVNVTNKFNEVEAEFIPIGNLDIEKRNVKIKTTR